MKGSADLLRVGVRVAGPVQPHHHHEVGAGVAAYLLGERLDGGDGSGVAQRVAHRAGCRRPTRATASGRGRGRRSSWARRASA